MVFDGLYFLVWGIEYKGIKVLCDKGFVYGL